MIPRFPPLASRCAPGLILAGLVSSLPVARAADTASEQAQLAILARQLDMAEQVAERSARLSSQNGTRYHFDYARLREDLRRMRAGVHDYLTPQRAQPHDPVTLDGHYRRESRPESAP